MHEPAPDVGLRSEPNFAPRPLEIGLSGVGSRIEGDEVGRYGLAWLSAIAPNWTICAVWQ